MKNQQTEQQSIGLLIKSLRQDRGLTQSAFSKLLKTSQSAVARMEKGEQNLSTKELSKISKALEHPLVSISKNNTDNFIVNGGKKLSGTVKTNTSKNGAMGLMCASMLNKGTTILHGIPRIQEVYRMMELLESIGVSMKWTGEHTLTVVPPKKFAMSKIDKDAAARMRSALMLIGPLSHHVAEFKWPHAGGCNMGTRSIGAHRYALLGLGVNLKTNEDHYLVKAKHKKNKEVTMHELSDTGTEQALMTAALIPGETRIHFATENYMVQDVMGFLRVCGVEIYRENVTTLIVKGISEINETVEYTNAEDPIDAMAFITAGILTDSEITIERCPIDFLRLEIAKLENMGQKFTISAVYYADNGFTKLVDITTIPSKLRAPFDKIHPLPFPGINVDNMPFFVPIAAKAKGQTLIHDWMWENRAIYFTELNRLGANIKLLDPHRALVNGGVQWKANEIVCPPALRPSVIIFLAMLAAPGTSILRDVYVVKRGYEKLAERLNDLGADIKIMNSIAD